MKESYIEHVILEFMLDGNFDTHFGGDWVDEQEFIEIVERMPFEAFAAYGFRAVGRYGDVAAGLVAQLQKAGAISKKGDEYAGYWYKLDPLSKVQVSKKIFDENLVRKRLHGLPEEAFRRALDVIAKEDGLLPLYMDIADTAELSETIEAEIIPASDRIVTLNHNQQIEIEEPLNKVIELVEAENSIDGESGLRELVLGRLKAGRELVQAGLFSLRSLQLTLVIGLQMLVEKYGDLAIGIAAAELIDLLLKHHGIG